MSLSSESSSSISDSSEAVKQIAKYMKIATDAEFCYACKSKPTDKDKRNLLSLYVNFFIAAAKAEVKIPEYNGFLSRVIKAFQAVTLRTVQAWDVYEKSTYQSQMLLTYGHYDAAVFKLEENSELDETFETFKESNAAANTETRKRARDEPDFVADTFKTLKVAYSELKQQEKQTFPEPIDVEDVEEIKEVKKSTKRGRPNDTPEVKAMKEALRKAQQEAKKEAHKTEKVAKSLISLSCSF